MFNQYNDGQLLVCIEKMAGRKALLEGELYLCWLVEDALDENHRIAYIDYLGDEVRRTIDLYYDLAHATWQQRTLALAKVKRMELV